MVAKATQGETAWRRVDRQQLADLAGVNMDTISEWSRAGMPVLSAGRGGRASVYDAVECLAWHRQRLGKNAKDAAITRAANAAAARNELKLARERGELLPADDVVSQGQAFVKAWVALIRGLPRRFVQGGVTTQEKEAAAADICRDVLAEISRWNVGAKKARRKEESAA